MTCDAIENPNVARRVTGVLIAGILGSGITALVAARMLKSADHSLLTVLHWGLLYFACLIAPGLTAWVTSIQLKRYINFMPAEAKRILQTAAWSYVFLGFCALLLAIG